MYRLMKFSQRLIAIACFVPLALSSGSDAVAGFVSVVIDSHINADLRDATNGAAYPIAPTTLTVGGVQFNLKPLGAETDSLGIYSMPVGASDVTILTNIVNATTVYSLINSGFGKAGEVNGRVEFVGDGGAFASFELTQGFNIRDHFNGFYNNVVTDPTIVTEDFGSGVRLDRQTFVLPVAFATQTLTEIHLIGTVNANNFLDGIPFVAGVTVETAEVNPVPEPASLTLLSLGAIGLAGAARRRRQAV